MTFAKGAGDEPVCYFKSYGTGVGQIVAGEFCNCAIIANSDLLNVFPITTGSGIDRVLLDTVSVVARTQINPCGGNAVIKLCNTDHLCTLCTLTDIGTNTTGGNDVDVPSMMYINTATGDKTRLS